MTCLVVLLEPGTGALDPHRRRQRGRDLRGPSQLAAPGAADRNSTVQQHAQIRGAVEPGLGADVKDVLHGRDEMRQMVRAAAAGKAPQLEIAASRRHEEEIVVDEARIDRLRQEEGIAVDVAVHIDNGNALLCYRRRRADWCC